MAAKIFFFPSYRPIKLVILLFYLIFVGKFRKAKRRFCAQSPRLGLPPLILYLDDSLGSDDRHIKLDALRILIVEDDVIIARLIKTHLEEAGHFVLGIEHSGEKALDKIHNHQPDLVLLDINLAGNMDGIDVAEKIYGTSKIPFIFLTALSDLNTLNRAMRVAPCGYVVKPYKASDLYSSIAIGLYNHAHRERPDNPLTLDKVNQLAMDPVTKREFDLIVDISQGLTNAQISEKQHLSLSTVKWHLQNIYSKLGVRNRASAVKQVLR